MRTKLGLDATYHFKTLAKRVTASALIAVAISMNSGMSTRRSQASIFAIALRCHPSACANCSSVIFASRRLAAITVTVALCHLLRRDFIVFFPWRRQFVF